MNDLNDPKVKEFMEKHFKAGEYSVLTIFVKNQELGQFMELLKVAGLNLAILPGVQAKVDFADETKMGTKQ